MTKQIFKGEVLTRTKVVNRLVATYLKTGSEDRYDWYLDAHNYAIYLAKTFNVSVVVASGIISALSPVKRWEENKKLAFTFIKTGGDCGGHMKQFLDKARLILQVATTEEDVIKILNGRKIVSFFRNILHPNDPTLVTIDRHALSLALGVSSTDELYSGMTKLQYEFFVHCYQRAAEKLGISPLLLQSATWVYFRNNKKEWKAYEPGQSF